MNLHARRFQLAGPAGVIEVLRDEPGAGIAHHGMAITQDQHASWHEHR